MSAVAVRQNQIAEAMSDPFSILGFLSFGIFIFSILYHKHHKRPEEKPAGGQGGTGAGFVPPTRLQLALDPQALTLLKFVSDMIGKANEITKTDLVADLPESEDYEYEEAAEAGTKTTPGKKAEAGRSSRKKSQVSL